MEDLYLDRDTHTYYYKGDKKDCVSDILEIVDVVALKGIPIRNLENAAIRGTRVHEETENFEFGIIDINDDEWLQDNRDIVNYVYAYANFLNNESPEKPLASEESFYSIKYDFAGTIDLVKYFKGKLSVIDKKSSKTVSNLRSILQLNAYRLMWNEKHPDQPIEALYILQLSDNGTYETFEVEINEQKFLQYLNIFKEIKGDKKLWVKIKVTKLLL